MTEPTDFHQIAREYRKDGQALLLTLPAALFAYSIDRVGVIGFDHIWMWACWLAWASLAGAAVVAVGRILLIPWLYDQLAISHSVVGILGANAGANHRKYEPLNAKLQWWQLGLIAFGFAALLTAHVSRSISEALKPLPAAVPAVTVPQPVAQPPASAL